MRIFAGIEAVQDRQSAERGVPRYTLEFAVAMQQDAPDVVDRWLLRAGEPLPPTLLDLLPTGKLAFTDDRTLPAPDVLHALAPFERVGKGLRLGDVFPDRLRGTRTKLVSTLYDLIPLIYADHYLVDAQYRSDYRLALDIVTSSDLVLTISESTARDASRLLHIPPARLAVIGTGVPESFADPALQAPEERLADRFPELRPGFLLSVGGMDFRKNMAGLIQGYALLDPEVRDRHQLVLVCKLTPGGKAELAALIADLELGDSVLLTDAVSDGVLRALYSRTALFIFASLYEGFGLPVVEALRSGAPVVVGDNSSLRDIVPQAEARFDASDPRDIARVVQRTLSSEERRMATIREVDHSGHVWANVVAETVNAYRRLRRSPVTTVTRPRIAFVTPLPPAPSGVSTYSERLLRELHRHVEVDVFAQHGAQLESLSGVELHSYGEFPQIRGLRDYQAVVVAIGNSDHHLEPFEILSRYGGTAMMHDARLTGLMSIVADSRPDLLDPDSLDDIRYTRRGLLPERLHQYGSYAVEEAKQTNALLAGPVVRAADQVLVHSLSAQSITSLEAPSRDRGKVAVLPFGFPLRSRGRGRRDAVTSFGLVTTGKQAELLCRAFILAAADVADVVFAFVGDVPQAELRQTLEQMIHDAGLDDRILLSGRVDDAAYDSWLDRSILTIQPRTQFNGESSAAVAESIGAGVPTLVSDLGWMAELPGDVVEKIPRDVTAAALAEQITRLLEDPDGLERMSRSGVEFARLRGFDSVALALLAALGVAPSA